MNPIAVLFDLDDTLSDHLASVRAGLADTKRRHSVFADVTLPDLEAAHSEILEETHLRLLAGEVTQDEARITRTQRLFALWDVELTRDEAAVEYQQYRKQYESAADVVPGTRELLDAVEALGIRIGVITNNLVVNQHKKLHALGLFDRFEMLTISEEVGVAKPDPHIFSVALDRMALGTDDVVMVGDSLTSDIAGALGVGIAAVWLDRRGLGASAAPEGLQAIITDDFSDTQASVTAICG